MGHLAFVGSHKINGVSALHTDLMRQTVFHDLNAMYPDRIVNKTNGITFRRWLFEAKRTRIPLTFIVAALLLYVFIMPGLLNRLVGLPFAVKLLVSALLLVPLGFAMGMPFPTGLRALASVPRAADN